MDENLVQLIKTHGSPLMITDCDIIRDQYKKLQNALPNVTLHYALKPNPHPIVVKTLNDIGSSFDIATRGELELVKKLKIDINKCIHTHPIKKIDDIKHAIRNGITSFVVDNPDEILKFKSYNKKVKLMLRVSFRNPTASIDLSKKFGCDPNDAITLIELAKKHKLHVNALAFHVGSQSKTPDMYVTAIERCNQIIAECILKGHPIIEILDIGGGFPITYDVKMMDIKDFCAPITKALLKLPSHIKIISEPGRFLVGTSTTNISSVVGKAIREGKQWYYLDDGVYGSYSDTIFDHVKNIICAVNSRKLMIEEYESVLCGPTCDSIDVITSEIYLQKLEIGDLLVGKNMGAYSTSTSTIFNMIPKTKQIFLNN